MKVRTLLRSALLLGAAVASMAATPPESPQPAAADRVELAEVVQEAGVATAPASPGWSSYLKDLGVAFVFFLARLFEGFDPQVGPAIVSFSVIGARILFLLTAALLGFLLVRWLVRRLRPHEVAGPSVRTLPGTAAQDAEGRSSDEWAARLEGHLAAGEVAAACEALWWWLARSLLSAPVEASWTSRELLSHAGRNDLKASVRILDRLIYGATEPSPDDVHRLWGELREALA